MRNYRHPATAAGIGMLAIDRIQYDDLFVGYHRNTASAAQRVELLGQLSARWRTLPMGEPRLATLAIAQRELLGQFSVRCYGVRMGESRITASATRINALLGCVCL